MQKTMHFPEKKKKVITISYIRKTCLLHVPKLCHQVFNTQYFSARFGKKRHLLPLKPAFHKEKTCRQESRAKLRTPTFPTLLTSDQEQWFLCFTLSQGLKPFKKKHKGSLLVLRYRGYQQGLQSAPCDISPKTFRLTQLSMIIILLSPARPTAFKALPCAARGDEPPTCCRSSSTTLQSSCPAFACCNNANKFLPLPKKKKGKRPKPQLEQTYRDPLHLPKPQG